MDDEKTCSGFGVEKREEPVRNEVESWSDAQIAIGLGAIVGNLRHLETSGSVHMVSNGGPHPTVILLEAANRLVERKEP